MLLSREIFKVFSAFFLLFATHSYSEYNGLTFQYLGPNCFGTALKISGQYDHFRGVDDSEFSNYIRNYCTPVEIPTTGDVGVFKAPGSDFVIHAFVHINEDTVIEKSGVDYVGITPIKVQSLETTLFTFESSVECKKYSGNHPSCHNELTYYSCNKPTFKLSHELNNKIIVFERKLESVLIGGLRQNDTNELLESFHSLVLQFYKQKLDKNDKDYLMSKIVSYEKQLKFLKLLP